MSHQTEEDKSNERERETFQLKLCRKKTRNERPRVSFSIFFLSHSSYFSLSPLSLSSAGRRAGNSGGKLKAEGRQRENEREENGREIHWKERSRREIRSDSLDTFSLSFSLLSHSLSLSFLSFLLPLFLSLYLPLLLFLFVSLFISLRDSIKVFDIPFPTLFLSTFPSFGGMFFTALFLITLRLFFF